MRMARIIIEQTIFYRLMHEYPLLPDRVHRILYPSSIHIEIIRKERNTKKNQEHREYDHDFYEGKSRCISKRNHIS